MPWGSWRHGGPGNPTGINWGSWKPPEPGSAINTPRGFSSAFSAALTRSPESYKSRVYCALCSGLGGLCFPQILILAVPVQLGQHRGQRAPCSHQHQVPRGELGLEEGH